MSFTMDNTEGFTPSDITELNTALTTLLGSKPADCDDDNLIGNASDLLNNAWANDCNTADALVSKVRSWGYFAV